MHYGSFPDALQTVSIYHLPKTGGQTQPYPSTPDLTVDGTFLPMDRYTAALEGGNMVNPFELYVEPSVDLRVGDKVVVGGVDYFVKKVWTANFGMLRHTRASCSTQP